MSFRARRTLRLLAASAVAVMTTAANGAAGQGRQPPPGIQMQGFFHLAAWEGSVSIAISENEARIVQVDGILPGTCDDKRTGRVARAGRDGAIGVDFVVYPNASVRRNGTFSFTAKATAGTIAGGYAPHTITMRGTFYGNNALGRISGTGRGDRRYSKCRGEQPFWAKRVG